MKWKIIGKDDIAEVQGGLNRYVFGLGSSISDSGDDVSILVSGRSQNPLVSEAVSGNAIQRVARFFILGWRTGPLSDIVNIHFAMYGAPFLAGIELHALTQRLLGNRARMPAIVYNFHGPWGRESRVARGNRSPANWVKDQMERFCLIRADRVIVLSAEFADRVIDLFRIPANIVSQIPPGVDRQWFGAPTARAADASRAVVNLVCVRRLTPRMGHLELLENLEKLNFAVDSVPVVLHIVGRGESATSITDWVTSYNRAGSVRLHGFLEDDRLRELMTTCQGAVIPTTQLEGYGLVVLEAMAMGLPVISTGQGGLSEAMGPWAREPFVFRLDDPDSLLRSLRAIQDFTSEANAQDALVRYARRHEWSETAKTLRGIAMEAAR